ncbi:PREDICTED: uncharacterized protein LOC109332273 [Lupinus angustifolius]|uniref:uncharacterized protein LOC109332273 n=1 Tax=Lupinus angustifolius TaxID=3871 RepID=UPI00092FC36F|nr:PREDICTED: uncharacterized protein LOC109332273 [Lupinus angustifolius]
MEKDLTITMHRSSCISGCMMSPSCFQVHNEFQYTRVHYYNSPIKRTRRGLRWRNILNRLMREGKTLCGSKPIISFHYDPVSYSQNFDEGCHLEDPRRFCQVFPDVSAAALNRLDSQCKI